MPGPETASIRASRATSGSPLESNWESLFPYPSQVVDLSGVRYAYVDVGQGSSPMVCVHGNPTWSFYWRRILAHFSPTRRVLAVDHVGCGRSDKPQRYPYNLATHRDNLLSWIERLDLRNITLVVHDWGGAIGLGAAVQQPERFARLVITNTGAFPPPYLPWRIAACRLPFFGTLALRGLNAFARAATTMAIARQSHLPKAVAAGLLAPYDSWNNRVAIDRFVKDIPRRPSHPTYRVLVDIERQLPRLSHLPILLMWGMRDWCFRPECLSRFEKIWPQATVIRLPDVGHYVMEDAPEEVCQAIERFFAAPPPVS